MLGDEQMVDSTKAFENRLQDGVILAKIAHKICAEQTLNQEIYDIEQGKHLSYKHTDNINIFFDALKRIEFPDYFTFELVDLWERKNMPKVILCLHALSNFLHKRIQTPRIIYSFPQNDHETNNEESLTDDHNVMSELDTDFNWAIFDEIPKILETIKITSRSEDEAECDSSCKSEESIDEKVETLHKNISNNESVLSEKLQSIFKRHFVKKTYKAVLDQGLIKNATTIDFLLNSQCNLTNELDLLIGNLKIGTLDLENFIGSGPERCRQWILENQKNACILMIQNENFYLKNLKNAILLLVSNVNISEFAPNNQYKWFSNNVYAPYFNFGINEESTKPWINTACELMLEKDNEEYSNNLKLLVKILIQSLLQHCLLEIELIQMFFSFLMSREHKVQSFLQNLETKTKIFSILLNWMKQEDVCDFLIDIVGYIIREGIEHEKNEHDLFLKCIKTECLNFIGCDFEKNLDIESNKTNVNYIHPILTEQTNDLIQTDKLQWCIAVNNSAQINHQNIKIENLRSYSDKIVKISVNFIERPFWIANLIEMFNLEPKAMIYIERILCKNIHNNIFYYCRTVRHLIRKGLVYDSKIQNETGTKSNSFITSLETFTLNNFKEKKIIMLIWCENSYFYMSLIENLNCKVDNFAITKDMQKTSFSLDYILHSKFNSENVNQVNLMGIVFNRVKLVRTILSKMVKII